MAVIYSTTDFIYPSTAVTYNGTDQSKPAASTDSHDPSVTSTDTITTVTSVDTHSSVTSTDTVEGG